MPERVVASAGLQTAFLRIGTLPDFFGQNWQRWLDLAFWTPFALSSKHKKDPGFSFKVKRLTILLTGIPLFCCINLYINSLIINLNSLDTVIAIFHTKTCANSTCHFFENQNQNELSAWTWCR